MRVNSLLINNLRNIKSASIETGSDLNCFIGANGAGKTTILEALVLLSKGRSFRSGHISSLIGPEQTVFQVASGIESQSGSSHQLGLERGNDHWIARHNGENVTQISELTYLLPHVLLEPSSHTLISGPPEGRRKYLDWGVFHVKQGYLLLWRRYTRALKQRNAALRQNNAAVLESLDTLFVQLGEQLHQHREKHAEQLSELLRQKLPFFNDTLDSIDLSYRKGWTAGDLADVTQQSLGRDMERGLTSHGPHKADLYITLDGAPAKERLSRGEQKALTAAMVMIQAEHICQFGEKPVLLLDDLSSELDEHHLEKVLKAGLELEVQIWLTGTRLSSVIRDCGASVSMFHVEHGQIQRNTQLVQKD